MSPDSRRTVLAASAASTFFGASVVATRFVVAQTNPVSLAFLRYLVATLCLLPVLRAALQVAMPRRDLFAIGALGALFFGIFPWSFSAALVHVPASRVALMLATTPLVTLVISRARGVESITMSILAGQLLAIAGLWLALGPSPGSGTPDWLGYGLTLVTVLCGAMYNVFSRPYLKRYRPLHVTALSMAAGALFLAPLAAVKGLFTVRPAFSAGGWLAVVFLGTVGGALGFALWIWALERSTPSRVAVFIALNPITATLLGALLMREPVTATFVAGLACVVGGIILANWRSSARAVS
ncbi:MAG: DMT family transporter [Gemmatimonadaceae bacterium]|nr:DMT family transporter [Gemmatimonadaceae bacterium]